MPNKPKEFTQSFFHGTRADLKPGEEIAPSYKSNYGERNQAKFVYLTANLNVAVWGAELAMGKELPRIYVVEPTGPCENDPNVTDKKFPGNPTNSYRTLDPLRVVGEVIGWQGHSSEEIKLRKEALEQLFQDGAKIIED